MKNDTLIDHSVKSDEYLNDYDDKNDKNIKLLQAYNMDL